MGSEAPAVELCYTTVVVAVRVSSDIIDSFFRLEE